MGRSSRKVEELICDDIALVNKVLNSADLQNLYVRKALYDGIRKGQVFSSPLGKAFLNSLMTDEIYNSPDVADLLLRDMDALRRIMEFMKTNTSVQAVERMRQYRFKSSWVQRFTAQYLDGGIDGHVPAEEDPAEVADLMRIRKLVRNGSSEDGFRYDETYSLMEKYQDKNLFRSWLGKLFMELVRVQTTEYKKKRQLKKWLGRIGVVCCLFSIVLIFWGLHLKEQERVDEQLAQLLREEKNAGATGKNTESAQLGDDSLEGGKNLGENVSEFSEATETGSGEAEPPQMLAKYRGLYKQNPDMVGWLAISGTTVNYPVMQRPGQADYYLSHDFLGNKSYDGLLFIDGDASLSPMDGNLVIYGHNMKSGSMFGSLMFYKSKSFFEENPGFQFDTLYEERSYQIVAVLLVDTSKEEEFHYYECRELSDEQIFQSCREFIREHQLYETGYDLEYGDQVVMLSTCESTSEGHRLVVVGRLRD